MMAGVLEVLACIFLLNLFRNVESPDFELMWVEIKINSINLLCGVCYRPPCLNTDMNVRFLNNLQTCFNKIYANPDTLVVLTWMVITTPPIPRHVAILYSWMECNNLFQVINEPTRITPIGATLLDLVITNYPVIYDFAMIDSTQLSILVWDYTLVRLTIIFLK